MKIKERLRCVNVTHENYIETVWYVDVTDYAMKIFGNVIGKAEITLYYDEDNMEEAEREASRYIDDIEKHNHIDFDASNMLITLINRKQIDIWNSEYGGIRIPNVKRIADEKTKNDDEFKNNIQMKWKFFIVLNGEDTLNNLVEDKIDDELLLCCDVQVAKQFNSSEELLEWVNNNTDLKAENGDFKIEGQYLPVE